MPGPASNAIAAAKTELPVGFDYSVTTIWEARRRMSYGLRKA
jgi:hypothetical protein